MKDKLIYIIPTVLVLIGIIVMMKFLSIRKKKRKEQEDKARMKALDEALLNKSKIQR